MLDERRVGRERGRHLCTQLAILAGDDLLDQVPVDERAMVVVREHAVEARDLAADLRREHDEQRLRGDRGEPELARQIDERQRDTGGERRCLARDDLAMALGEAPGRLVDDVGGEVAALPQDREHLALEWPAILRRHAELAAVPRRRDRARRLRRDHVEQVIEVLARRRIRRRRGLRGDRESCERLAERARQQVRNCAHRRRIGGELGRRVVGDGHVGHARRTCLEHAAIDRRGLDRGLHRNRAGRREHLGEREVDDRRDLRGARRRPRDRDVLRVVVDRERGDLARRLALGLDPAVTQIDRAQGALAGREQGHAALLGERPAPRVRYRDLVDQLAARPHDDQALRRAAEQERDRAAAEQARRVADRAG